MNTNNRFILSRRHFVSASLGASAVVFAKSRLFAQEAGIVPTMIQAASQAKIEVYRLRRNISVLEGSGGNIAVLTGKDGKLLIDAGFTVSRSRVAPALYSLSADSITRLINTHWHVDHTDGNAWLHGAGAASRRMKTPRSTCRLRRASMSGAIRFRLRLRRLSQQPSSVMDTASATTIPPSL